MESRRSAFDGFGRQAAIKCRQTAAMGHRQRQQIGIGNLRRRQNLLSLDMFSPD
jgi:hypothetical protein